MQASGVHPFLKLGLKPLLHLLVVLASPALLGIFPVTEPLLFGFGDDDLGHNGSSTHMVAPTGLMTIHPWVFKVLNY